jgi:hypothetical protein
MAGRAGLLALIVRWRKDELKTAKHRGQAVDGFRNFDDAKANGERDWH